MDIPTWNKFLPKNLTHLTDNRDNDLTRQDILKKLKYLSQAELVSLYELINATSVVYGSFNIVPIITVDQTGRISKVETTEIFTNGIATLVAGTVTVMTPKVNATSRIFLTPQEGGSLNGTIRVSSRVNDTSFDITSSDLTDTADIAWLIMNQT